MKKFLSVFLCGVCAFASLACAGCGAEEKDGSTESGSPATTSSVEAVVLDILEGNFTQTTFAEMQAFCNGIVISESVEMDCVVNNGGAEFAITNHGDDEGEWDGSVGSGKVLPDQAIYMYEIQGGTRDAVVTEQTRSIYYTPTERYIKETTDSGEEKYKGNGSIQMLFSHIEIGEDLPDLKVLSEESNSAYTYAYYMDETDATYTKIKLCTQVNERRDFVPYGEHDYASSATFIFAFDKANKIRAFSYVCTTTRTFSDKVWTWTTEYILRPYSGGIDAPSDLSTYE